MNNLNILAALAGALCRCRSLAGNDHAVRLFEWQNMLLNSYGIVTVPGVNLYSEGGGEVKRSAKQDSALSMLNRTVVSMAYINLSKSKAWGTL